MRRLRRVFNSIRSNGLFGTLCPLTNNIHAIFLYRIANALYRMRVPELPYVLYYMNAVLFGCEIHYKAEIGKKFCLVHSHGVIIGRDVVIGNNVSVYSGAVIGNRRINSGMPRIGDNVTIGSGAKVLGDIKIGNNVKIGANSVVLTDIPDGVTVVGIPARQRTTSGNA